MLWEKRVVKDCLGLAREIEKSKIKVDCLVSQMLADLLNLSNSLCSSRKYGKVKGAMVAGARGASYQGTSSKIEVSARLILPELWQKQMLWRELERGV